MKEFGSRVPPAQREMITLADFAERVLTPQVLQLAGLPNTEQGRCALDALVEHMLTEDRT